MTCGSMTETLMEYVDRRLAAPARAAFERHLRACEACRGQVRWLTAVKAAAAKAPAPAMPADLKAQLLAQARAAARRKSARRWRQRLEAFWRPAPVAGVGLALGLAAAAVVLVVRAGAPVETIPLDDMLAAHRAYELTMPLNSETTVTGLADALAGGRP